MFKDLFFEILKYPSNVSDVIIYYYIEITYLISVFSLDYKSFKDRDTILKQLAECLKWSDIPTSCRLDDWIASSLIAVQLFLISDSYSW